MKPSTVRKANTIVQDVEFIYFAAVCKLPKDTLPDMSFG